MVCSFYKSVVLFTYFSDVSFFNVAVIMTTIMFIFENEPCFAYLYSLPTLLLPLYIQQAIEMYLCARHRLVLISVFRLLIVGSVFTIFRRVISLLKIFGLKVERRVWLPILDGQISMFLKNRVRTVVNDPQIGSKGRMGEKKNC